MMLNEIVVLAIVAGIGMYFFFSGLKGLKHGRMTVVNPDHGSAWPGPVGYFMHRMRQRSGIRESTDEHSPNVELQGSAVKWRAWFYIVMGLACFMIAAFYLDIMVLE
ncbi:MAG: hypothetical protein JSV21_04620 [Nitrospirota bacterium]|nr:MAG: hypothetical protein JSV21_04620 [Nitrospirota bacterium]